MRPGKKIIWPNNLNFWTQKTSASATALELKAILDQKQAKSKDQHILDANPQSSKMIVCNAIDPEAVFEMSWNLSRELALDRSANLGHKCAKSKACTSKTNARRTQSCQGCWIDLKACILAGFLCRSEDLSQRYITGQRAKLAHQKQTCVACS